MSHEAKAGELSIHGTCSYRTAGETVALSGVTPRRVGGVHSKDHCGLVMLI